MKMLNNCFMRLTALTILVFALGGCLSDETASTVEPPVSDPGDSTGGSNSAPTISGTPSKNIMIGQNYSFTPTASDPDGDALTFSIQNKPTWATFTTSTGNLSGTPTLGDIRSYPDIIISVTDGMATASLGGYSLEVTDVGRFSVTLSWMPPTENADNTALTDLAAYKFYYGLSEGNYPNEIYVDSPGLSSYTVQNLTANTYYFVVTAINQSGAESTFSNVVAWVAQ